MLFQNDPFREIDAWLNGAGRRQTATSRMSMDAYRRDNDVWVHIDLPGVAADGIEIDLDRNVLTVSAERSSARAKEDQVYILERAKGRFQRQVHLGDGLDSASITADYDDGVLTLRIPVSEKAQPRKISVGTGHTAIDTESVEA
ncbi:MAG: Hsp20/alpha crystallin family protein [Holophagales bacterium]|nr:Hsp20/alpha crystallin family protein [Holophagales bacterium]